MNLLLMDLYMTVGVAIRVTCRIRVVLEPCRFFSSPTRTRPVTRTRNEIATRTRHEPVTGWHDTNRNWHATRNWHEIDPLDPKLTRKLTCDTKFDPKLTRKLTCDPNLTRKVTRKLTRKKRIQPEHDTFFFRVNFSQPEHDPPPIFPNPNPQNSCRFRVVSSCRDPYCHP